jgi:hypothetical protein
MPVTVTKPELKVDRDEKGRAKECRICARIENTTAAKVKRAISFFYKDADGDLEEICTREDIEIDELVTIGPNSRFGSVEVCCEIACPESTKKILVAMGTKMDANNYVNVDKAEDKKEATIKAAS